MRRMCFVDMWCCFALFLLVACCLFFLHVQCVQHVYFDVYWLLQQHDGCAVPYVNLWCTPCHVYLWWWCINTPECPVWGLHDKGGGWKHRKGRGGDMPAKKNLLCWHQLCGTPCAAMHQLCGTPCATMHQHVHKCVHICVYSRQNKTQQNNRQQHHQ